MVPIIAANTSAASNAPSRVRRSDTSARRGGQRQQDEQDQRRDADVPEHETSDGEAVALALVRLAADARDGDVPEDHGQDRAEPERPDDAEHERGDGETV